MKYIYTQSDLMFHGHVLFCAYTHTHTQYTGVHFLDPSNPLYNPPAEGDLILISTSKNTIAFALSKNEFEHVKNSIINARLNRTEKVVQSINLFKQLSPQDRAKLVLGTCVCD